MRSARTLGVAIALSSTSSASGLLENPGATVATYSTLCGLLSYSLLLARRSLQAVDVVVEAVENQTAEFVAVVGEAAAEVAQAVGTESVRVVEAVGSQTVKAVPIVSAVLLTLLLLALRNIVARLWYSRKETMKRRGETPEGMLPHLHAGLHVRRMGMGIPGV